MFAGLAVALATATGEQGADRPIPARLYPAEPERVSLVLDAVCEAALTTVYQLGATMVRTSLDPVTGTPIAGGGALPADRREWIEARFEVGGAAPTQHLLIELGAVSGAMRPPEPSGDVDAVAVWVEARAKPAAPIDPADRRLANRFLGALDRSLARRLGSAAPHGGRGPTPTPWIGAPLEPPPLGPPELAPRTPVPGP